MPWLDTFLDMVGLTCLSSTKWVHINEGPDDELFMVGRVGTFTVQDGEMPDLGGFMALSGVPRVVDVSFSKVEKEKIHGRHQWHFEGTTEEGFVSGHYRPHCKSGQFSIT